MEELDEIAKLDELLATEALLETEELLLTTDKELKPTGEFPLPPPPQAVIPSTTKEMLTLNICINIRIPFH